jgi:hypothetical protein
MKNMYLPLMPLLIAASLLLPQASNGYYNSSTGRWITRDPAEEAGGLNLCCFIENQAINHYDVLGKSKDRGSKKAPSGWEDATVQEVQDEIKRLERKGDPRDRAHLDALKSWRKVLSRDRNPQGRNQNYRRARARGGGNVGGLILGGAATAAGLALEKVITSFEISQMREAIDAGTVFNDKLSSAGQLYDFVRHVDSSDTMWAELDAAVYAAQAGGNALGLLVVWDTCEDEIQNAR